MANLHLFTACEICDKAEGNKKKNQQEGEKENSTTCNPGGSGLAAKSAKRTSSKQSRYNQNQMVWFPKDHMLNSCMHLRRQLLISQRLELTAVSQDRCLLSHQIISVCPCLIGIRFKQALINYTAHLSLELEENIM